MAQLILGHIKGQSEQRFSLRKKLNTVGTDPSHDIRVAGETAGLLFTLVQQQDSHYEVMPAGAKVLLNGQVLKRATVVKSCDRIEWVGGAAVFLHSPIPAGATADTSQALQSLSVLQNLAATLQTPGSLQAALYQALEALVEMSGAEVGYLLSEMGRGAWELVASRQDSEAGATKRKELFSNTILQEALTRREPVYVENIIGHPWAEAASVIEARIFSAACFPLCVGERTLGAVFLFTRSPGKSIRREALVELSLLATQAALMLGTQVELKTARKENAELRSLVAEWPSGLVAGPASPMIDVARKISKLAPTPLSVLVLGETGTGKEVVARELHRQSSRAQGAFVAVNCAAIPTTLLESVLFGHERGAFTGAVRAQAGKFVQAHGGTLFLDEIGDLPFELQAKLLRVLQERVVEPLGSSKSVSVDVRILAATHQDLDVAVKAGRFRQDLYFRLNGAAVKLPPLRERLSDLSTLATHFLKKIGSPLLLTESALEAMERYSWPGNVRELEQVITRAALLCEGVEITLEDLELPQHASVESVAGAQTDAFWRELDQFENLEQAQLAFTRDFVQRALKRHEGSRMLAASELGISERTLYRILASEISDASGGLA